MKVTKEALMCRGWYLQDNEQFGKAADGFALSKGSDRAMWLSPGDLEAICFIAEALKGNKSVAERVPVEWVHSEGDIEITKSLEFDDIGETYTYTVKTPLRTLNDFDDISKIRELAYSLMQAADWINKDREK
jgi:hypothetical protein